MNERPWLNIRTFSILGSKAEDAPTAHRQHDGTRSGVKPVGYTISMSSCTARPPKRFTLQGQLVLEDFKRTHIRLCRAKSRHLYTKPASLDFAREERINVKPSSSRHSFHCYGFGQVPGLVYVGSLHNRHMIGEKLHGDRVDERCDERVDVGHFDRRHAPFPRLSDALRI
jgi:hypothetical protein